jgi:hypothetical protein
VAERSASRPSSSSDRWHPQRSIGACASVSRGCRTRPVATRRSHSRRRRVEPDSLEGNGSMIDERDLAEILDRRVQTISLTPSMPRRRSDGRLRVVRNVGFSCSSWPSSRCSPAYERSDDAERDAARPTRTPIAVRDGTSGRGPAAFRGHLGVCISEGRARRENRSSGPALPPQEITGSQMRRSFDMALRKARSRRRNCGPQRGATRRRASPFVLIGSLLVGAAACSRGTPAETTSGGATSESEQAGSVSGRVAVEVRVEPRLQGIEPRVETCETRVQACRERVDARAQRGLEGIDAAVSLAPSASIFAPR